MNKTRQLADRGWQSTRRNLVINGDFAIWQRGISHTGVTANEYHADRFRYVRVPNTAVLDVSRAAVSNIGGRICHHYELDVTTADTSVAAGDYAEISTRFEGYDINHLAWGTADAKNITISFWHAHTKTGTHNLTLRSASDDVYIVEYAQSVSNTWEKAEMTIPGPTTGTWASDNTLGLAIRFVLFSGSDFYGSSGSWQNDADVWATSNLVNNFDSTSNYFRLAQLQIEEGDDASSFETRSIGNELEMCQRYYCKSYNVYTDPGTTTSVGVTRGFTNPSGYTSLSLEFPVTMRSTPSVTLYSYTTGATGNMVINGVNRAASASSAGSNRATSNNSTAGTANAYALQHWTADAEL